MTRRDASRKPSAGKMQDDTGSSLAYQMLKDEADSYTDRMVSQMGMRFQFSGVLAAMCIALLIFVVGMERHPAFAVVPVFSALTSILLVVSIEVQSRAVFVSPDIKTIVNFINEGSYMKAIMYSVNTSFDTMDRAYHAEHNVRCLWGVQCIASAVCLISFTGVAFL